MLASLMTLGACSTNPKHPPINIIGIDHAKIARCEAPAVSDIETNRDVINALMAYRSAFYKCAAQIDAIRKDLNDIGKVSG